MPHSIILHTHPASGKGDFRPEGHVLYAAFLETLRTTAPDLAEQLYRKQGNKPFTLSLLHRSRKEGPDGPLRLRVTLLDDALFPVFTQYFLSGQRGIRVGDQELLVSRLLCTPESGEPLACYASYRELWEGANNTAHRIPVRFLSPTTFKTGDLWTPFPLPHLCWNSWARAWTVHSGHALEGDLSEKIQRYVAAAYHRIASARAAAYKGPSIGFKGEVTFEIQRKGCEPHFVRIVNVLADFAVYCGTGAKTTMGMGQTVRITDEG